MRDDAIHFDPKTRLLAETAQRAARELLERQAAAREMWANLSPDHRWLKNWEYV